MREKWLVTEYRDGTIYKTKSLGLVWVDDLSVETHEPDTFYGSPSTDVIRANNGGIRRKPKEIEEP